MSLHRIFVCFRQLSGCLRSPLCVIAPHFRVCALRLCVFPPIVCVSLHCVSVCVRSISVCFRRVFVGLQRPLCICAAFCVSASRVRRSTPVVHLFPLFAIRFFSTLALLSSQWLCLCVCMRSGFWFLFLLRSNVLLKRISYEIGVRHSRLLQLFSRKSSLSA